MLLVNLCDLFSSIFEQLQKIGNINQTFNSLVLKVAHPKPIEHFRPISLSNVAYKLVTEILATRLRLIMPMVIASTQCSFIQGKSGSNNITIGQEVIHKMRNTSGSKGFMATKIDLEKTYIWLCQGFIIDSPSCRGVNGHFIHLIWCCISPISVNIL